MNIYLDESYNLQKSKGKMFISINGFAVLNEKALRKRWKGIRKKYVSRGRIHANDKRYEPLRPKALDLLFSFDIIGLSVFQIVQEIPPKEYFYKDKINFEKVYLNMLKCLLKQLSINEYKRVNINIDSRTHKRGLIGAWKFQEKMNRFLENEFIGTDSRFYMTPSYLDVLVELADFVSNTFYKEYISDSELIFDKFGSRLLQIKNPL
ncbi:DUF3800 domain-containing protein [Patescibacteria group bacterium]|nr:DUF3800 domain-containing protein [Patescibacteria group bacterium]MBU1895492.1 DUF3800 domain-containing protein [Patescibacteria group bacterium]